MPFHDVAFWRPAVLWAWGAIFMSVRLRPPIAEILFMSGRNGPDRSGLSAGEKRNVGHRLTACWTGVPATSGSGSMICHQMAENGNLADAPYCKR